LSITGEEVAKKARALLR